jgi:hypothetical protein
MADVKRRQMDNKEIERILAETLVPVEPSTRFVKRLKARLVHYRGGNIFSGWMILVAAATIILVAVTIIRLILRGISLWAGLISNLGRKQRGSGEPTSISVSG